MNTFQAIVLAVIEGITEFLPISSTGHMAIASAFFKIEDDLFTKLYLVVIQLGAILAVTVVFWRKLFNFVNYKFYLKLFIAMVPALLAGVGLIDFIKDALGNTLMISIIMVVGGLLLLGVDKWFKDGIVKEEVDITNKTAFMIGLYQVLSVALPGLSRSAATIIGGMQQKLTRSLAAEFSFFLAIPTMFAATVKSVYDIWKDNPAVLNTNGIQLILLGSLVAFIIALIAIKFLISFLQKNGFKMFGWYRIIVGTVLILLILTGKL
jgi:undecaprenyl-diphosphatase